MGGITLYTDRKTKNKDQAILNMDAYELAKLIKEDKLTSLKITETYIQHLKQLNLSVNCLVEDRFIEAIKEAKHVDDQIKKGIKEGLLLGVPISIKELFDVANMKTTGGLLNRKNDIKKEDAEIVLRLKKEGAIIIGKTNTPILSFCQETDNKLYGRTNNPWNLDRTAGGSSGGEAALIASGGAAVGIGSDIGGSIRMPAHFNGVIGFKSGYNQVSDLGTLPKINIPLQSRMLGIGALSKSVRDARLINDIIAERIPSKLKISDFDLTIPVKSLSYPIDTIGKDLISAVKEELSKDFKIQEDLPPFFKDSTVLWQLIMSINGAEEISRIAFGEEKSKPFKEYIREKLFKSSELHHYFIWTLIGAKLFKPSSQKLEKIQSDIENGDSKLSMFFKNRLLIIPVYHSVAKAHGEVYNEIFSIRKTYMDYMPFIAYANLWGLPSLVVPIGEDENNMPIAVQIVSKVGNEDAIFQLGEILEKKFRGYRRKEFVFE